MTNFKIKKGDELNIIYHDYSDNADSIGHRTSVVLVRFVKDAQFIPSYVIQSALNKEFNIPFIAKKRGYAEMNESNPYDDNIDLQARIPFEYLEEVQLLKEKTMFGFSSSFGLLESKYISNFLIIEWDGVNADYKVIESYDSDNKKAFPALNTIISVYNAEVEKQEKKKEETANIDKALAVIKNLNKKELAVVMASLVDTDDDDE